MELRKRWHARVPEQHTWLSQVLRGHYGYYGLIFNAQSLNQFYQLVKRMWFKARSRNRRSINPGTERLHDRGTFQRSRVP